ncbi:21 kDa -like [Olea europaea subsp. europaea]|uniref:21 kDa -like n=1 Tax=Olea europaea subsp. europaea TaxID=158383 RepID=A0A8S0RFJ5_OLEEU|nr:21 kDa -like [Olea europaea subsp. europaea]
MKTLHLVSSLPFLFTTLLFHLQQTPALQYSSSSTATTATVYGQTTTIMQPTSAPAANNTDFIRKSCKTTLYPELCYDSLARYANVVQQDPDQLVRIAVRISLAEAKLMPAYVSNLTHQTEYGAGADPRVANALHDCSTVLRDAIEQIRISLKQLGHLESPGPTFVFQVSNVQTWMSAALTYEETCTDGFSDVPDGPMKSDLCGRVLKLKEMTSNALALVNNYVARTL